MTLGHWTPLSILAIDSRFIKTSWPALSIANLSWSHELNTRLNKNVMALPQTLGFKAEAVDEERVWCACTVEEDDDYVIVSFHGWNWEWNRRVCNPRKIRDRTLPDRKRKRRNLSLQWTMSSLLEDRLLLLNITQTEVNKSSNYGSLQFQAWICIIFHGRNLYEFQRSKPFSKLHLLYLYPLSKQTFSNYSQNTRRSSLPISRSWNNAFCYGSQSLEILPKVL